MIFDTHAHYDDDAFAEDAESLLDSFAKSGSFRIANIGASMEGSRSSIALASSNCGPIHLERSALHGSLGTVIDKIEGRRLYAGGRIGDGIGTQ